MVRGDVSMGLVRVTTDKVKLRKWPGDVKAHLVGFRILLQALCTQVKPLYGIIAFVQLL